MHDDAQWYAWLLGKVVVIADTRWKKPMHVLITGSEVAPTLPRPGETIGQVGQEVWLFGKYAG